MPPNLKFRSFGLSDIGLARSNNEDVWMAIPERGFFALADGMGGHQAGEVAAKEALTFLLHAAEGIESAQCIDMIKILRKAIEKANQWVFELGREIDAYYGMGTTLCCLIWTHEAVVYAHVGDSRVYRFRGGKLELLTKDHSLLSQWMDTGRFAEEGADPLPSKNVLTRAVGTHAKVMPEIAIASFEPDDLFLLCSDGLSDALSREEIEQVMKKGGEIPQMSEQLITKAKLKGGSDNITVLMVQIDAKNLSR